MRERTEPDFASKLLSGLLLLTLVAVLVSCGVRAVGDAIDPAGAAQRRASQQAERQAQQAAIEKQLADDEAERRIEAQLEEVARETRLVTQDRANKAAYERYAECQIRNQTPGYCAEDWRPTAEIEAMNEIAREGRF